MSLRETAGIAVVASALTLAAGQGAPAQGGGGTELPA